jgi:hypothetical protein
VKEPREEEVDGFPLPAKPACQLLAALQQLAYGADVSRMHRIDGGDLRQAVQLKLGAVRVARDPGSQRQMPGPILERELRCREVARPQQPSRGAGRVGERPGGPEMVGKRLREGLVVCV